MRDVLRSPAIAVETARQGEQFHGPVGTQARHEPIPRDDERLPEVCFTAPDGAVCGEALTAAGAAIGLPELPRIFGSQILPICCQLGSMLEAGSDGPVTFTCYPPQVRQAEARRSAFSR